MRVLCVLLLCCPAFAQFDLFTCASIVKAYVVGAKLPASGLFFKSKAGPWEHAGFNHPFIMALDYDERGVLYLAGGNGMIRASDGGRSWKILTGSEVTELRDVAIDRRAPGTLYFAHTAGIRVSRDGGASWSDADSGIRRKYTEAIRVDRARAGHLVAGAEEGLYFSADGGHAWQRAGAAGLQVMHIEQSPHDDCFWLAVTQQGGIFASRDCGRSFENLGSVGVGRNLYDVAFDPTRAGRIAVAGWGPGVVVSDGRGKTWVSRNAGLPRADVWSVAFDPGHSGRIYCSVHEEALYVSDDAGVSWRKDGLEGSIVHRMAFVPERRAR
jgi:BNR/Asp-box repeat.